MTLSQVVVFQRTYVCRDTSEDHLLLPRGLHGHLEFRVVPSIDLAIALDEWSVRVHLNDFSWERAIGTCDTVRHVYATIKKKD